MVDVFLVVRLPWS